MGVQEEPGDSPWWTIPEKASSLCPQGGLRAAPSAGERCGTLARLVWVLSLAGGALSRVHALVHGGAASGGAVTQRPRICEVWTKRKREGRGQGEKTAEGGGVCARVCVCRRVLPQDPA